jgi:hypothetical protein
VLEKINITGKRKDDLVILKEKLKNELIDQS